MMMSDAHTPTPWKYYWREEDGIADCGIFQEKRAGHAYSIARCPKYQSREQWEVNAAFIVRACNSHDKLVAALSSLLNGEGDWTAERIAECRAALKAAEESK